MKVYTERNRLSICKKCFCNCTVEARQTFGLNYSNFSALRFKHYLLPDVILNSLRCVSFIGHVDYKKHIEIGWYPRKQGPYQYYKHDPDFYFPHMLAFFSLNNIDDVMTYPAPLRKLQKLFLRTFFQCWENNFLFRQEKIKHFREAGLDITQRF